MKVSLHMIAVLLLSFNAVAQEEESIDFKLVDVPPITADCNPSLNNAQLRSCFTKSVTNQVVSKINSRILQSQGLTSGTYRINVIFSINKKGKVKNVKANFTNKKIRNHIIDAVKSINKMTPAYLDAKAVVVNYAIPIKFKVK